MNILVTGGKGFIGSHFIEEILKRNDITKLWNVDSGTYASNKNLPFENDSRYQQLSMDIATSYFPDHKKYFDSLNVLIISDKFISSTFIEFEGCI